MNEINTLNKHRENALLKIVETLKSREFLNIIDDGDILNTMITVKNEILKLKYYELKLKCDENQKKKRFSRRSIN
jgi:hypothetical protein